MPGYWKVTLRVTSVRTLSGNDRKTRPAAINPSGRIDASRNDGARKILKNQPDATPWHMATKGASCGIAIADWGRASLDADVKSLPNLGETQ
jgi:hypothetical protein